MQGSLIRIFYRTVAVLGAAGMAACYRCDDCEGNVAPADAKCRVVPTLSPAAVAFSVGGTITVTTSIDAGCAAPIVRNSAPDVIRLDIAMPTIRVTALKNGTAFVRLLAAADTTLQIEGMFEVGPPRTPP